jgi:hypothetical protein
MGRWRRALRRERAGELTAPPTTTPADAVRLKQHEECSQSIQNTLLALLASCLFALLAVGAVAR